MSEDDGKTLQLEIDKKCGEDRQGCKCTIRPDSIEAKKDDTIENVTDFVAYTHSNKTAFTLQKDLDGGESLEGDEIEDVMSVSIYYWSGDKAFQKPLLIEVIKYDAQKIYYKRSEDGENDTRIWKKDASHTGGASLQALLDDQNCALHNVIPFVLDDITKGIGTTSNCAKEKGVEFVKPYTLPGSDHIGTEYKLNGLGTGISRVEYQKNKIGGIDIPTDALDGIKLYSSPVNGNVPLMLNFKLRNGDYRWYYSKTKDGQSWGEDGGNGLYNSDGKPTEALTNKLDGFACQYHNGVTVDLSHDRSTSSDHTYCCSEHAGKGGNRRVTVTTQDVTLSGNSGQPIKVYKHSVGGGSKLADIKFYHNGDENQRKHIQSNKLGFPMTGPVDIYTFYSGNNPVLIYVNNNSDTRTSGWYRMQSKGGENKRWLRIPRTLKSIKQKNIEGRNLDCKQWTALGGVLNKHGTQFQACTQDAARQGLSRTEPEDRTEEQGSGEDDEEADSENDEESDEDTGDSSHEGDGDENDPEKKKGFGPASPVGPFPGYREPSGETCENTQNVASSPGRGESSWLLGWSFGSFLSDIQEAVARGIGQTLLSAPAQAVNALARLPVQLGAATTSATSGEGHSPHTSAPTTQPPDASDEAQAATETGLTSNVAETPKAEAHGKGGHGGSHENSSNNDWKVIFGGSASATVVSGSITGFGWWAFNRYKGDPWVRYGYPRVFKECTILGMHRSTCELLVHRRMSHSSILTILLTPVETLMEYYH
ncbi:hypothetical protein BEWA_001760 [Theileria equi strain WA]|uniref:Uncharacterized protein n=1 Tax=Theileria equi strain WA TaxID=1537102 RepID=L0B0V4_THEEQ|nr:hypothetical protein BEWA_001760 [Theileria equi strain WA]AFZ80769.1 hypothetical protein BEWA_001760 [Theileria equi strain WA]|eukprot:XP_004830435.1 hypothetical protein BEWA_001760 [Theileria equi strain WA]